MAQNINLVSKYTPSYLYYMVAQEVLPTCEGKQHNYIQKFLLLLMLKKMPGKDQITFLTPYVSIVL